jgi:spermidine synthase
MTIKKPTEGSLLWVVLMTAFLLSGMAGLIYESIWTHYLKLYLGHASYAQTLVLAAFLSGLALGAWWAARLSFSGRNLLRLYAMVEVAIGLLGLIFHGSFVAFEQWSFDVVIPQLGSPGLIFGFKWTMALLLVAPQSILLGMTFPLMVGGVLRVFTSQGGRTIASFYFINSLGAGLGVWLSGFYLIGDAGLPGTVLLAAILNLLVGVVVLMVARRLSDKEASENVPTAAASPASKWSEDRLGKLLLACAFGTGLASFIYEITWIRMLNLVLGTSTHAFELMLGTFILGMALGSLIIRRYLDRLTNPVLVLGMVQLVMALAAGTTIAFYNELFTWMEFLMQGLAVTTAGYVMFNLSSLLICAAVMLPATICAGMTLPLITHTLRSSQGGEAAVGRVYATNTLGSIAGVVLVASVLIPLFGLKWALFCGVLVDLALGLILLRHSAAAQLRRPATISIVAVTLLIGLFMEFNPNRQMSGVYFRGLETSDDGSELLFYRDGSTASVAVKKFADGQYTILNNGKPDAGLRLYDAEPSRDEGTMVLIAAMPLAVAPRMKEVAIVGFGSGITTQTLLKSQRVERVDTIEIEPAMVAGARSFYPRVARVFEDPRSHIHIEDAKTFFSTAGRRYDAIISEPSNPWVSGVGGLFSQEYYRSLQRYLKADGLLAQWIHTYEFSDVLLVSILKALGDNFPYYQTYQLVEGDVLVLASRSPIANPSTAVFDEPELAADLRRVQVYRLADLQVRYLAGRNTLHPYFTVQPVLANSDYFPVVDLGAVRARYLGSRARILEQGQRIEIALQPALWSQALMGATIKGVPGTSRYALEAIGMRKHLKGVASDDKIRIKDSDRKTYSALLRLEALLGRCEVERDQDAFFTDALLFARQTNAYAAPGTFTAFWDSQISRACFDQYSERMQLFIRFLRAVAERDNLNISQLGQAYLPHLTTVEREYVLFNLLAAEYKLDRGFDIQALMNEVGVEPTEIAVNMLILKSAVRAGDAR